MSMRPKSFRIYPRVDNDSKILDSENGFESILLKRIRMIDSSLKNSLNLLIGFESLLSHVLSISLVFRHHSAEKNYSYRFWIKIHSNPIESTL